MEKMISQTVEPRAMENRLESYFKGAEPMPDHGTLSPLP